MSLISNLSTIMRTRVDRVKPWNLVRNNLGLGLRGLDIRPGLDNRHLIIECHRCLGMS